MFCEHCGKKISDDSTVCKYCGKKPLPLVDDDESAAENTGKRGFFARLVSAIKKIFYFAIIFLLLVGLSHFYFSWDGGEISILEPTPQEFIKRYNTAIKKDGYAELAVEEGQGKKTILSKFHIFYYDFPHIKDTARLALAETKENIIEISVVTANKVPVIKEAGQAAAAGVIAALQPSLDKAERRKLIDELGLLKKNSALKGYHKQITRGEITYTVDGKETVPAQPNQPYVVVTFRASHRIMANESLIEKFLSK